MNNKIIRILVLMVSVCGLSSMERAQRIMGHVVNSAEVDQNKAVERAKAIVGHITNAPNPGMIDVPLHPAWQAMYEGKQPSKKDRMNQFIATVQQQGSVWDTMIPPKTSDIARIATYNVHFWRNPFGWPRIKSAPDFKAIVTTMEKINADILLLQEVGGGIQDFSKELGQWAKARGYKHIIYVSTSKDGVDAKGYLYNAILSKYPLVGVPYRKQYDANPDPIVTFQNPEQRAFVNAKFVLPNNQELSVYATHLEVRPLFAKGRTYTPEQARVAQVKELLNYIAQNDASTNIVIGADFNGFRVKDLQQYQIQGTSFYTLLKNVWPQMIKEQGFKPQMMHLVDKEISSAALDYFSTQGWRDSFEKGNFRAPQFTTWFGTRIDFLFLNPGWNLPLSYSGVLYDAASDHLPVFMDIKLK